MQNLLQLTYELQTKTLKSLLQGFETLQEIPPIEVATTQKEVVWQSDKVTLYHYTRDGKPSVKTPLLIAYALVNRHDMMDLQPDRSLIRKLLEEGLDIYIIDWGYADRNDRYLSMDDYLNGYLDDCVDFVRNTHKVKKINLLGVCQGGTFSTIYAATHPAKISNLVTMVTPIDFSIQDGILFNWARHLNVDALIEAFNGVVPGSFLNTGFEMLKPLSNKTKKYIGMMDMVGDSEKLLNFLRMEKWINDSPAQAGECFRQFIKDLYQQNKLVKGDLQVGPYQVNLKKLTMPLLNIFATEDHLVPPSSTKPLNDLVGSQDKQLYEFPGGHIGVFVGGRSQKELAPTIAKWLKERDK
jgi:polyhydroxyalkanoate synthase